jgi:hypothetical protein
MVGLVKPPDDPSAAILVRERFSASSPIEVASERRAVSRCQLDQVCGVGYTINSRIGWRRSTKAGRGAGKVTASQGI